MKAPSELWIVARALGDALNEVVFVGGMIRELLITDPAAGPARPTQDVDCIVDATSYADYLRLCDRLRAQGFHECTDEGAPICRWVVAELRVDVMPIDPAVLGFSNVWYPSAVEHSMYVQGPDTVVRIIRCGALLRNQDRVIPWAQPRRFLPSRHGGPDRGRRCASRVEQRDSPGAHGRT